MEDGWERRTQLPAFSGAAIESALANAGVRARVPSATPLAGGFVNCNVRVEAEFGPAVFRIYLREAEAAAKEAALLIHVAGRVPAPEVLASGTLPTANGDDAPWLLLSWIEGEALAACQDELAAEALTRAGHEIGTALTVLHRDAREHLGFLDAALQVPAPMPGLVDTWTGYLGETLASAPARSRLGTERSAWLDAYITSHAGALAALEDGYALLHADCKPTNVFVRADGSLAGFLDWEFAWSGPPLFDLGQMLRWPVPPAYEVALVEGYASQGGTLPPGWRHLARLLDLMNLVGFLGQREERPRQTADVLRLIDAYRD